MNSSQCLWSSRETSQKLTAKRTTTAATAVRPSSSSRCTGAISSTTVASTHVSGSRQERRDDAAGERFPVAAGAAGAERAEEDRQQQHDLDSLPEEDREGEEEGEQGRREPLVASVRSTSTSPEWISAALDRISDSDGAVADSVAELREAELEVEHEVRIAEPQRHFRELEMVEIGGAGEVVSTVAVTRLRGSDRLVDEAASFGDACPDLGELVARRGRDAPARRTRRRRSERTGRTNRRISSAGAPRPCRGQRSISFTVVSISSAPFQP